MQVSSEVLAGFKYLGSIEDVTIYEQEKENLTKKVRYIPTAFQSWYSWILDHSNTYDRFPTWEQVKEQMSLENDCVLSVSEAKATYYSQLNTWESDYLASTMTQVPIAQRRDILAKLATVLGSDNSEDISSGSVSSFSLDNTIIVDGREKESYFKLPTRLLNEVSVIRPGAMLSVVAPPANFKTQYLLNCIYLNSVLGSLNSLYIYLENTEMAYQIELLARHSYTNGMRVENASLKRKVSVDEVEAVKRVQELQESLRSDMKGKIYFINFGNFNSEPLRFAAQLSDFCKKNAIGFVGFDYLQRSEAFKPPKLERREFMNQLMMVFSSAALGSYGCNPFVGMMLSQPTKDAAERMLKTRGTSMSLYDSAEVSSIGRDSFLAIGLYSDAEYKLSGKLKYKILKNRDGEVSVALEETVVNPAFCFLGDEGVSNNTVSYTQEGLDSILGEDSSLFF
jgi:hypothetical protein